MEFVIYEHFEEGGTPDVISPKGARGTYGLVYCTLRFRERYDTLYFLQRAKGHGLELSSIGGGRR